MIKGMAFAFALSCISFAAPQTARAAEDFTFAGDTEKLTTTKYKFWGVAKEVDAKKADFEKDGKYYKLDEVAPVEGGAIDLSFLNKKKENIIALGEVESFTDASKWIVKPISAQNTNFKAAFLKLDGEKVTVGGKDVEKAKTYSNADLGAFAVVDGDTVLECKKPDDFKKVEVKLGRNGEWVQLNQFFGGSAEAAPADGAPDKVIARLSQGGADLAVRLKGNATNWASKEVKVKFTKQGKAPNLVVDTAKGMINFKKGQEYRVALDAADIATVAWKKVEGKLDFKAADAGLDGTKDAKIQVRDAATVKKPASKIATVELKKQDAVTAAELTKAGDLVAGKLKLVVKVPYDLKKGAYIENSTKDEYEIYIASDGTKPAATAKWIKVKAGKADKKTPTKIVPSKTNLKYSKTAAVNAYTDTNENAKIFVRLAGTKQNKVDGSVKLASPDGDGKAFKLAAEQGNFTNPADFEVAGKIKTEIIKTVDIAFSKLFKDGVAPKITVTDKVSGVTVKASKMKKTGEAGNGKLTVKVSKSAFKTAPTAAPKLKFKIFLEGVEKEVTVTLNITQ